ncbi:ABC transporter ATP-binding protein [Skermanella stibiiresistens SB22]|uniref:ABC transporter ATP-binding protein n=1 Tax=Skermanella stibiiresistens SB22 TaxID=1385369 RepID=W9H0G9_9PROT|nr:type I secretion system permease/ATPase [Skermanella stibiiresistens]EWY39655.1 ABC transporter ATP-binding protein [Skermanella stibiiresistens SB22]
MIDNALLRGTLRHLGKGMVFSAVLSCFINLLMLIVPLYTMQVYDRVMTSRSTDTLVMLAIVAVGGLCVYAVLDYIRTKVFLIMSDMIARRLNVPTLQAAVIDTLHGSQRNSTQAIRDLNDLRSFITGGSITVPLEVMWVPMFLVVLFLLHPIYGWLALGAAIFLFLMSVLTDILTRRPLAQANEAAARSFSDIASTVRNAEVIEAMGMLPAVAKRWERSQYHMIDLLNRGNTTSKALSAASRSIRLMLQLAMISTACLLVINREASPGSAMAAGMLIGRVLHPFELLIDGWRQWVFALSALNRVRGLLNGTKGRRESMPLPRPEGRLTIDRLVYIPPGVERPVLKGISFSLEPGETLGIIGPSAAGKSTLARLLVGIWEPTAGGIYLDGHSTFLWERESFGHSVGYLPQNVSLLDGTIRDNISRMTEASPLDVVNAAKMADVHEMIGRLPFGYDTTIGDAAYSLSGGQRQRIGLARALFGNPRLLVLDEPNSNLDSAGEQALLHAIAKAKAAGTTVVLIAHRPSVVAAVDKLLVLKDGMIDQFGARADVLKAIAAPPGARQVATAPNVARLVKSEQAIVGQAS